MVNLPVNFESTKPGKAGKTGGLDPELILDALEKMRDYIAAENKKMREEFFKLTMEFEGKVREKIDKRDLDDIESKKLNLTLIGRLTENVEMQLNLRLKKFIEKD